MPATVYVAEDAATPRWQFLLILANKSDRECTLADFRVSGVFAGAEGGSVAEAVPTKSNPAEWGVRLKPNELGGISVLDRFATPVLDPFATPGGTKTETFCFFPFSSTVKSSTFRRLAFLVRDYHVNQHETCIRSNGCSWNFRCGLLGMKNCGNCHDCS